MTIKQSLNQFNFIVGNIINSVRLITVVYIKKISQIMTINLGRIIVEFLTDF